MLFSDRIWAFSKGTLRESNAGSNMYFCNFDGNNYGISKFDFSPLPGSFGLSSETNEESFPPNSMFKSLSKY